MTPRGERPASSARYFSRSICTPFNRQLSSVPSTGEENNRAARCTPQEELRQGRDRKQENAAGNEVVLEMCVSSILRNQVHTRPVLHTSSLRPLLPIQDHPCLTVLCPDELSLPHRTAQAAPPRIRDKLSIRNMHPNHCLVRDGDLCMKHKIYIIATIEISRRGSGTSLACLL